MPGSTRRTSIPFAGLLLSCALLLARPAAATLYTAAAGYQYTAGDDAYWGDELWGYGELRLDGGWYPYGRFSWLTDSYFSWTVAPTLGVEKGFPGLGKGRAGYTWYHGSPRHSGSEDTTHVLELGWYRAFTPAFSGDLAYRYLNGDLFTGSLVILNPATSETAFVPRHSVFHQGALNLGWDLSLGDWRPRLEAGLSASSAAKGDDKIYTQGFSVILPVLAGCSLQSGLTLSQDGHGHDRYFAGGGLFYTFAGRFKDGAGERSP